MKKRKSILDFYKDEIKKYIQLNLSIRCIYLLINDKLKKQNLQITYPSVRNYVAKLKENYKK